MTRIAIVGTGPSGLYLGKYLTNLLKGSKIDFFEKSHRLFGLFRYGIAPDKPSIRSSCFSLINSKYRFFTGLEVGNQLKLEKLLEFYKFVFLCCGAEKSRLLRVKNEQLGVFNGLDLIKYYNYRADRCYRSELPSDLRVYEVDSSNSRIEGVTSYKNNSGSSGVEEYLSHLAQLKDIEIGIIGNGNVALDIVRAFSGNWDQLSSDQRIHINPRFLQLVKGLNIKRITLFGRSSLIDSKFTNGELRELLSIKSNSYTVGSGNSSSVSITSTSHQLNSGVTSRQLRRKLELFQALTNLEDAGKRRVEVDFRFNSRVVEAGNDRSGNIEQVQFVSTRPIANTVVGGSNGDEKVENRQCNLLVKCVGYELSDLSQELLNQVDNRRVFANGWLTSGGRGDLNHTITRSVELARYVNGLLTSTSNNAIDIDSCTKDSGGLSVSPHTVVDIINSFGSKDILSYLQSKESRLEDTAMEFAKLEEVQGLKFQHALVVPRSSYADAGLDNTLSSLVVGKYNVLIQYGGPIAKFYHLPKVIDAKGVSDASLLMTLDVGANIVSLVSPSATTSAGSDTGNNRNTNMNRRGTTSSSSDSSELDLEDLLLIETASSLYVYTLINHSYLYTYRKPSNPSKAGRGDKGLDRLWYRITSADESLMLLVVDGAGRFALINVKTGSAVIDSRLLGQGLDHSGIGVGHVSQDKVRLVGNVDSSRILIVTRSNKLYLVDLNLENASATDRKRVYQLTIKSTGSGSDDLVTKTLNGDYEVVGCHVVNDTVLLAIIISFYDDNMVLMCNIETDSSGNKELTPLGYCYNEFFLTRDEADGPNGTNASEEAWIAFKHVEKWDLFIAYSNKSTSTVLITCNRKLREANAADAGVGGSEYNVLLMSEGYCLESNDFENHVLGVFVYTNYKNEIYRNSSLEDTPTLKDPVVVGLVIDSGDVSMFYVDRHILGADNKEEEIMCELYSKERDVTISSSGADSDADEEASGSNEVAIGGGGGGDDDGISSIVVQKFLAKYYKDGFDKYRNDKRLFKLHEALCNSLEYFNSSLDHMLNADDNVGDGRPIRVSNSIKGGYNADCKLDKLKDYNLIIKKLLNIQQDLCNDLYKISVPGSPVDANDGGTSGSETPLSRYAGLNGRVDGKDSGKELMDKMYNLLDNLSLQSMESVSADNVNEVESSLMYINSCLNSLYRRFDSLENKLLDVHNQMVFNEIAGGYGTNTWLAKYSDQLPESSPTNTTSDTPSGGVSGAGRSTSVVERKLERLVDDIVRLYNRPLLDLSAELGNLGLRNWSAGASGATLGEGLSGLVGGTKLKYNNYEVLFKGSGGSISLPSGSTPEQSSAKSLFSGSKMPPTGPDKSSTLGSASESKDSTPGRGNVASTSVTTVAVSAKTFTASTGVTGGSVTKTSIGGGLTIGGVTGSNVTAPAAGSATSDKDSLSSLGTVKSGSGFGASGFSPGVDKSDSAKTSIPSIFGSSVSATPAPDKSVGIGASAGDGGEAGKVKFGLTTSLLSGYNLMPSSLETANASGTVTPGGIGGSSKAPSPPSGTSAFAGFNTNKSLLDIALNSSSQVGGTATNALGGAFPTTTSGGGFVGAGSSAGAVGGSFLNSSTNAGIGTSNLGPGNAILLSPGPLSPFRSGTSSPFGGTAAGVASGSFTGAGNFAANSFPASGSVFGSNPPSDSSSLYNQGGGNVPAGSSTSIFGASSSSVFGGGTSSSGLSFFGTSPGTVANTAPGNSAIGGGGIFGTNAPGANLSGDLWGASRRSNPLD
ncbi:hypothetical protein MACJ_001706 [Theileria orientalis]|uniref:Uncharacterized protein n=1 Tax=Theileria orientalis TaxID=68886 RepID=A0A976M8Q7_THEOR|nr:hypothetical protein MACJ_001706 [Theileria orientalis]